MTTIEKLQAEQASIEAQVNAILGDREADDLDAEEWAQVEALTSRDVEVSSQIKAEEEAEKERARRAQALGNYRNGRTIAPGAKTIKKPGPVVVGAPEWMKDPMKGYASPRVFLMEVMDAEMFGRESEQLRALKVVAAAGSDEQSGAANPYGGYLVPEGMSPNLLQLEPETDPVAGRTTNVPMTAPRVSINARVDKNHATSVSGGLRVYRRAETDSSASSRMEFEQITLTAHPLMGVAYATEEILMDSPISFAALLGQGFQDEFNSKILDERLNGTGVGQFLGVLKSPALITVAKEGAQTADTIVANNVLKMRARVWMYQNAIWLANHDTLPQLASMTLPAASAPNAALWMPSMREDVPDMLMGRPLFFTEYLPTLGDANDIICANWSQYLEGLYQTMQGAESIHVRFLNNERAFRFTARNDGQPWWRSALTPRNGATLSPFVSLAERA